VAGQEKSPPIKPPMASGGPQQQDQEGETRRLWDEGLLKTRQASRAGRPMRPNRPQRNYSYRRVTPALPATNAVAAAPKSEVINPASTETRKHNASTVDRIVGVTFWRLRPALPGDEARLLVQEQGRQEPAEWTPERVAAESPMKEGQFVRLSIEAPQSGYLYVIDREQYTDGSLGEPYLIFPTLRTNGGNNRVEAGRVVEIPAQDDSPSYFTMRPSSPRLVAEILTVIVSDQPLDVPALERNATKLSAGKFSEWEQLWKAPVERIEQVGGQGTAWTTAEKQAGHDESRRLTQDEPLPQTIYHVAVTSGQPIFINVPLLYGGKPD
jgi:hypothetical protein